jgi:hypothetical protein
MDAVLGKENKDAIPDYEQILKLKYCLAVFHETLRLHSNVPLNFKQNDSDGPVVLAGSGTTVYPSQRIFFHTWASECLIAVCFGKSGADFVDLAQWVTRRRSGGHKLENSCLRGGWTRRDPCARYLSFVNSPGVSDEHVVAGGHVQVPRVQCRTAHLPRGESAPPFRLIFLVP